MLEVRSCRNAYSGKDGYEMVSRVHLWKGGSPFYQGAIEIWRKEELGTVSVHGRSV